MITVSWIGLEEAVIRINRIAEVNTSLLMRILGETVRKQTIEHFQKGAGPDGPWAPLAPATVRQKRGGAGQTLVDTGRLMGSISVISGSNYATIGTNVFYGAFHQHGTRKMPRRRFLGFTSSDKDEIEHICQMFIARQLS